MSLKGQPTILVVDDEELMREVTQIIIEENGGKVRLAQDGVQAVEVFKANAAIIDLVFLDFSMPKMNGYEAYLKIKELKPDVGVVFASGLKLIPEVETLVAARKVEFLSKPFHETELLNAFRRLQDKR